jgi:hypothetical protein
MIKGRIVKREDANDIFPKAIISRTGVTYIMELPDTIPEGSFLVEGDQPLDKRLAGETPNGSFLMMINNSSVFIATPNGMWGKYAASAEPLWSRSDIVGGINAAQTGPDNHIYILLFNSDFGSNYVLIKLNGTTGNTMWWAGTQSNTALDFDPDGHAVLTDNRVRRYNKTTGVLMDTSPELPTNLRGVAVSPTTGSVFVGGINGTIYKLPPDLSSFSVFYQVVDTGAQMRRIRVSPSGVYFVWTEFTGQVFINHVTKVKENGTLLWDAPGVGNGFQMYVEEDIVYVRQGFQALRALTSKGEHLWQFDAFPDIELTGFVVRGVQMYISYVDLFYDESKLIALYTKSRFPVERVGDFGISDNRWPLETQLLPTLA